MVSGLKVNYNKSQAFEIDKEGKEEAYMTQIMHCTGNGNGKTTRITHSWLKKLELGEDSRCASNTKTYIKQQMSCMRKCLMSCDFCLIYFF
ncbi:hypothetical protein Hdeb2414_s0007g00235111 [Helianthus debilis subsp. tardiflorus]